MFGSRVYRFRPSRLLCWLIILALLIVASGQAFGIMSIWGAEAACLVAQVFVTSVLRLGFS